MTPRAQEPVSAANGISFSSSETTTKSTNGQSNNKNEVPPEISSGVTSMGATIVGCVGLLTGVYAVLYYGFFESKTILGLPYPAAEFCSTELEGDGEEGTICSRSDLFAFQFSSGLAITFCGLLGFHAWHITQRAQKALPSTPEGRLYGYLPESELLAAVNFSFQVWDFFISLLIPEHRTALMLAHHILAAVVSYCSLEFQVSSADIAF
jgi:hypothetical protein